MAITSLSHGGGCCGLYHLLRMTPHHGITDGDIKQQIKTAMSRFVPSGNKNRVAEVCLNRDQATREGGRLPRILREMGFVLVQRFRNSNSGNEVFIFHHIPKPLSIEPADLPFAWGPPIKPVDTFHRINRKGESPLVFDSLAAATKGMNLRTIVKIIKRNATSGDQTVWSLKPEVKNPFGKEGDFGIPY